MDPVNPVMHTFALERPGSAQDTPGIRSASCGRLLNLGVGCNGVVGRGVSITNPRNELIGCGIIGWG